MSVEMISPAADPGSTARQRSGRALRTVVGVLPDGTAFYAPIGEVITEGPLVTCHLCGRSLRSVTVHLRTHGWTKHAYCEAFGLERNQSLGGPETRKLRAAALAARLVFDPAIREGSAAGHARAKAGHLTRDAAAAARGRRIPEQRRRKSLRALAAVPPAAVARANSERATAHLAEVAATVAGQRGYPDLGSFVLARMADGASLATISREAGLSKDWLSRHLADVDPAAAAAARQLGRCRYDARWQPALGRLGFADVAGYLNQRHAVGHWTVNAIAAEVGVSHHAVETALRRHAVSRMPHAAKRHAAQQRAAEVAEDLGHASIADYVTARRAAGSTWQDMVSESGQPQSWLRRASSAAASGA